GRFRPDRRVAGTLPGPVTPGRSQALRRPRAGRHPAPAALPLRSCRGTRSAAGVSFTFLLQLALAVIPAILAITLHEAAHGYAALALGDDTARNAGRLSLNPLRHVDRVGTILLPGFLLISQFLLIGRIVFMFGWAKPVPVAAWKFRNPRRGMAIVATAGPLMNFFLAWVGAVLMPLPTIALPQGVDPLEVAVAQHPIVGSFL